MRAPRILVKAKPVPAGAAFQVAKIPFKLDPLFPEAVPHAAPMGATAPSQWHVADTPDDVEPGHLWDLCHHLQTRGFGVAGGPAVEFAEPDFEQQWPVDSPDRNAARAFAAVSGQQCTKPDDPDKRYPVPPGAFDWRWFQDPNHSGLADARSQVGTPANRITIAHLDTGYRKGHATLPQFLDTARQRSFVDGDPNPNDASDPGVGGFGNNPGHGTGTLSILAGSAFNGTPFGDPSGEVGGAPFATVIPVRVANSVVAFTNSSIAKGIKYAMDNGADVLSMSMGGVASQLWADMVNAAYEAGVTMVTAAGNNFGIGVLRVPRFIVYPARFRRVLAACGIMSNGKPYADFLDPKMMGGSYGPDSKMDTAMAAYTPNVGWAVYACPALIRFDGAGTSAATPQIASAAACWLQKNRQAVLGYSKKWMRVEAVRAALTKTAADLNREHFGKGAVRAALAMAEAPSPEAALKMQKPDSIDFPLLGPTLEVIFGAAQAESQQMLRLEAAQVLGRSGELQRIVADAGIDPDRPPADLPGGVRNQILEALANYSGASQALRDAAGKAAGRERPMVPVPGTPTGPTAAENPPVPAPSTRDIQVFAFDPVLGLRIDTEDINRTTIQIPWEKDLQPGPVGEYIEVVDVDPASNMAYAPVDLNHPHLLARHGLDPSEGVPQFHQQMAYAVAMNTIGRFEKALGRSALWAPHMAGSKNGKHREYVQRLRIYPHALREENAYYSPEKKSLLFGYFNARTSDAGLNLPGGIVFTSLSHDVVAHETTHALLDGLHPYYIEDSNPDVPAFHEAFADIVALFQHFTIPAALRHTIARSQGDLKKDNLLAQLAQQFGQASSGSVALRSALAKPPSRSDYTNASEPHDLGAVLVAAVFQAFLEMYDARVADLKRLATGGTGVLPPGDISVDLVNRMAGEAAITADHVLRTCIRALDYCPPVDLTFGEYLRAVITADMDCEPEDRFNYRTAFISGFRDRGIYPQSVRNLSEESLRWQCPDLEIEPDRLRTILKPLDLSWGLGSDRRKSWQRSESNAFLLWRSFRENLADDELAALERELGVYIRAGDHVPKEVPKRDDGAPLLQIHSVRPARRINSDGRQLTDLVVEATQRFVVKDSDTGETATYRGGCTLLIDMVAERIRYAIRKRVGSRARIQAAKAFAAAAAESGNPYFDRGGSEPFAMLHRGL